MSDLDELPPAPDVAGTSLDGTEIFTISAEENAALCRSTGVEPAADGTAHPIYYYIATQVAMGKSVAGVCETCEFDVDDGPMMGSSGAKFIAPLKVGESYKVTGEILSLVRKRSRKLGVMDVLTYRLRLHTLDGAQILETDNVWVLPRKELA
nr:A55 [uncultured bacterium]